MSRARDQVIEMMKAFVRQNKSEATRLTLWHGLYAELLPELATKDPQPPPDIVLGMKVLIHFDVTKAPILLE
jgi:hypothetical protein